MKKYDTEKVTDFFYRLNDAEKNDQIRSMAFSHLQSIGKFVKLRSKFKGKRKSYMVETSDFEVTPEDLWRRLELNNVQNKKRFDFFISHSFENKEEVLTTMKCLNKQGFVVYCDWTSDIEFLNRELVSNYTKMVLKKRLDQSQNIIFLKTKKALNSEWVSYELEYFSKNRKPIYYIELDDSNDSRLKNYNKLEFDFGKSYLQNPK